MGWIDKLWTASNWALDTTIHAVADTINTYGTLACTFGGLVYAVSDVLALQEINASYYGAISTVGNFSVDVALENMSFGFNDTFPLSYSNYINNGILINLTDYISPDVIRTASTTCIISGVALKTISANMNKWQQNREDQRHLATTYGIQISSPNLKEYAYASAEAVTGAISNALLSNSITAATIYFSQVGLPDITYPPHADSYAYGSYYNGPVITVPLYMNSNITESNFTVPLPFGNLNVLFKKTVDVFANVTYGGGLFFKQIQAQQPSSLALTETISTSVGSSAYLASNFFAKKAKQLHDDRIRQEPAYTPIY